jgi:hypothetical protein
LLAEEPSSIREWEQLLQVTRSQVAAAERGDWRSVETLMDSRVIPGVPCPRWLRDEYWGTHQALRELLAAHLVALEAEMRRVVPAVRYRAARDPVMLDRRG